MSKQPAKKAPRKRTTSDAIEIMDGMMRWDPELRKLAEEARINAEVAQLIYDERTKAGLTQTALAALVGTTQPVIARLEDADYDGHSLTMLQRIATALNQRIRISFTPIGKRTAA